MGVNQSKTEEMSQGITLSRKETTIATTLTNKVAQRGSSVKLPPIPTRVHREQVGDKLDQLLTEYCHVLDDGRQLPDRRLKRVTAEYSDYNYFNFQEESSSSTVSEPDLSNPKASIPNKIQQVDHTTKKLPPLPQLVTQQHPPVLATDAPDSSPEMTSLAAETNVTSLDERSPHDSLSAEFGEEEELESTIPLFDTISIPLKLFFGVLQYLTLEEIYLNVIPVSKQWKNCITDESNDLSLWKPLALIQEKSQEATDYQFSGDLFLVSDFEKYLNRYRSPQEIEEQQVPNPVFVHCDDLWGKLCRFQRLYNRICEQCFIHCFTGNEELFKGMPCEMQGKVVFFGPRHLPVGKSTLVHSISRLRALNEQERSRISPTTGLERTTFKALVDQTNLLQIENLDTVMNTFQHSVRTSEGCVVQVFVFDLSNESSLDTLMHGFMYEFIHHPFGDARRLLVGLKDDEKQGKELSNRAMGFATENKMFYMECSSVTGHNVQLLSRLLALLGFTVLSCRTP